MSAIARTALVTGATSGLGRAIAQALAARGVRVLVAGRSESRGSEVVAGIRKAGGSAEFIAADLSSAVAVAELARRSSQLSGGIDILVNNAGIFSFGPTAEGSAETFDAMYATNVRAPYLLTGALAPGMAARRWGRIVNVTTMVAHRGVPGVAMYASTKAALGLLTRSWSVEFAASGITVNAVAPGPVRTAGTEAMGEGLDQMGQTVPVKRLGLTEEIASAVAFLAAEGSGYVTGTTISVDGGFAAA